MKVATFDGRIWNRPSGPFARLIKRAQFPIGLAMLLLAAGFIVCCILEFKVAVGQGGVDVTIFDDRYLRGCFVVLFGWFGLLGLSLNTAEVRLKLEQITKFEKVSANVKRARAVLNMVPGDGQQINAEVICFYKYKGEEYEGEVAIRPANFYSEQSAMAYLSERIMDEVCILAVDEERPSEAFLMDIDRGFKRWVVVVPAAFFWHGLFV